MQYVPVQPDAEYDFAGYMRTSSIQTASWTTFCGAGCRCERTLFRGAGNSPQCKLDIGTRAIPHRPTAHFVTVRVLRDPTTLIRGNVWIDALSLRQFSHRSPTSPRNTDAHNIQGIRRQRYPKAEQVFKVPSWAHASLVDQYIFMAWMGLLAFGVLSFGAVEPWSLATLEMGSALLGFGWLLAGMYRGELHVQFLPIFIPALLLLTLILLQVILRTTAYEFETGNMAYRFIAIGLLMFVGAQVLNSEARFRTFGFAVTLFGAGVALLAILQGVTSPNQIYWTVIPRFGDGVFGPYVNHSHYAGLMEMLLPFPFLLANSRAIPEGRRGLGYVLGALMAASVFVSGSRGGVVAASVQLCLIYFLLRKQLFAESSSRQRNGKWLNAAAILVLGAVVLWLGGQEMITRISTIKDPFGNTVGATRLLIFKDTVRMIAQRPMIGWGAGAFQTVYPTFRSFQPTL